MTSFEKNILKILVQSAVLSHKQAAQASSEMLKSKRSFEDYLTDKMKVVPQALLQAKSAASQVARFSYNDSQPIEREILKEIPLEAAEQYRMVPIDKEESMLVVGMVDPTDSKAQEALRFVLLRSNLKPQIVVISEEDFKKIIQLYKGLRREVKSALEDLEQSLRAEPGSRRAASSAEGQLVKEAPVTKMVAVILKHAIEGRASDIHIEPERVNTRVRFRVDGVLATSLFLPSSVHSSIVARIKILASLKLDETRIPQDGRFSTQIGGLSVDFRVSTFPTHIGEKVVMRVLDPSSIILDLQSLGLTSINLRRLEKALQAPFGMIMVSGPTGSGKTTTLYAALSRVNQEGVNLVSLEDPVEYFMEGVNQSQINTEIGYTFASGLRHILRQDPDIVMVGEIRDAETAGLATQASLTGHLVFSTIHTNNAVGVIPRLIDMGVQPFLLPSSLSLVMAQRLVGHLCQHCKRVFEPHPRIAQIISEELSVVPAEILAEFNIKKPYQIWEAVGCPQCKNKRTVGRLAIFEVLEMTPQLKEIILQNPNDVTISEEARRQGMMTMKQDGIIKALQGEVAIEEVLRKVEE